MNRWFKLFVANFVAAFSRSNLLFHGIAIGLTAILVWSGFDWWYYQAHQIPVLQRMLFPAIVIGFFLPIIVPILLYLIGKIGRQQWIVCTAFAITQAAILGSLISSIYKAFTGRMQPDFRNLGLDFFNQSGQVSVSVRAPIIAQVDSGKDYLAEAIGGKFIDFLYNLVCRKAAAPSPGIRDYAIGAEAVTAVLDLKQGPGAARERAQSQILEALCLLPVIKEVHGRALLLPGVNQVRDTRLKIISY